METKKTLFDGKPYDPKATEPQIYTEWEKSGFFNPDNLIGDRKKNYIVYMPLPNVTGSLHMGHALDNSLQDILVRYHRMRGLRLFGFLVPTTRVLQHNMPLKKL
jgi:valyl-tRNA synthetase